MSERSRGVTKVRFSASYTSAMTSSASCSTWCIRPTIASRSLGRRRAALGEQGADLVRQRGAALEQVEEMLLPGQQPFDGPVDPHASPSRSPGKSRASASILPGIHRRSEGVGLEGRGGIAPALKRCWSCMRSLLLVNPSNEMYTAGTAERSLGRRPPVFTLLPTRSSRRRLRIWSWATMLNFDRRIGAPWNHSCGSTKAACISTSSAPGLNARRLILV